MYTSSTDAAGRLVTAMRGGAAVVVGVGLAASGFLLSQNWGGTPASPNAQITDHRHDDDPAAEEEWVTRLEQKVALMKLCRAGLHDAAAQARYDRARAAEPSLAYGIGPECRLIIRGP